MWDSAPPLDFFSTPEVWDLVTKQIVFPLLFLFCFPDTKFSQIADRFVIWIDMYSTIYLAPVQIYTLSKKSWLVREIFNEFIQNQERERSRSTLNLAAISVVQMKMKASRLVNKLLNMSF